MRRKTKQGKANEQSKHANKILSFAKRNRAMLLFFFASTSFFLFQHHSSASWDFSAFVLNAKYWAANGTYFELFRPPLMQTILSALGIAFGWAAAEYIYIVLASALFAFSSARLAESLGINRALFYIFSLNPFVLRIGLSNGTELLSLALLELFIAGIVSRKDSGHWLGLAALSRYNLVLFLPLAAFYRDFRKIARNIAYFSMPFIPWFFYNYIISGNIFTSIADSFANNVLFRQYLIQQFNWSHIWLALNFLIPLFAIGAACSLSGIFNDFFNKSAKKNITGILRKISRVLLEKKAGETIMFIVLFGTIYSYSGIPLKTARYLFSITIPAAYFSAIGTEYIASKLRLREAKLAIAAIFIFLTALHAPSILEESEPAELYTMAIERISHLGLGNCSIMSNGWVFLNYFGRTSSCSPWEALIGHYISQGNYIALFYHIPEPDYARNSTLLHSFPVAYENKDFIIIGNSTSCAEAYTVDFTYTSALKESVYLVRNETLDIDPCNLLFKGIIGRKACNLANLRLK